MSKRAKVTYKDQFGKHTFLAKTERKDEYSCTRCGRRYDKYEDTLFCVCLRNESKFEGRKYEKSLS